MSKAPRDLPASVRQRLLNLAQAQQEDFGYVLTRYALERLLYRLSCSPQRERFVLKGALLFQVWTPKPNRRTRDLDLLGQGENTPARLVRIFQDLCRQPVEADGLEFVTDSVRAEPTQTDQVYAGLRVQLEALLARARIALQIDIGFGDVITPQALEITYPTLLDFPAPRLRAYPPETVVAEKFQAMVVLGMANSRMKDLYDLWVLAQEFEFAGPVLSQALAQTFQQRQTPLPAPTLLALSVAFAEDQTKQRQWQAFLHQGRLTAEGPELAAVITTLRAFLLPPVAALIAGQPFPQHWASAGPWKPLRKKPRP